MPILVLAVIGLSIWLGPVLAICLLVLTVVFWDFLADNGLINGLMILLGLAALIQIGSDGGLARAFLAAAIIGAWYWLGIAIERRRARRKYPQP